MSEQFLRTAMLLGDSAVDKLAGICVAIFGVGGVGGYVVEGLARSGVGNFVLIDHDVVSLSNLNRQIIALHSTIGQKKVDVAKARILDINPTAKVKVYDKFYLPGDEEVSLDGVDYIVDAVDTVSAKIEIIMQADKLGIPVISSMGTGNKTDPTAFEIKDVFDTNNCALAKVMRRELKARGISSLTTVCSRQLPIKRQAQEGQRKPTPASVAWCPSVAGLIIASKVVNDLTNENK